MNANANTLAQHAFWGGQPLVLMDKQHVLELWPTAGMCFEQKVNAISRLVIVLTFVGVLVTRQYALLAVGGLTLAVLASLYAFRRQTMVQAMSSAPPDAASAVEGFESGGGGGGGGEAARAAAAPAAAPQAPVDTLQSTLRAEFHPTTAKNPFGNVLLTDIGDNPNRLAAAPSFNPDVYSEINRAVKKQTQMLNPTIDNTSRQIYGDLKDNYDLDNSMMRFYSMPNTRVADDQGAFAQYLYGDMYSAKESTPEGAIMRLKDNYRYILI